jgi:hypothetical protein
MLGCHSSTIKSSTGGLQHKGTCRFNVRLVTTRAGLSDEVKKNQFCSRTPSIPTVDAELAPGMLEFRISRRRVPLTQRLRVIL